jgi:hypothetical protein
MSQPDKMSANEMSPIGEHEQHRTLPVIENNNANTDELQDGMRLRYRKGSFEPHGRAGKRGKNKSVAAQ